VENLAASRSALVDTQPMVGSLNVVLIGGCQRDSLYSTHLIMTYINIFLFLFLKTYVSSIERARRLRRHPVTFFHTKHGGGGVHPTTTKVDQLLERRCTGAAAWNRSIPSQCEAKKKRKKKWVLGI